MLIGSTAITEDGNHDTTQVSGLTSLKSSNKHGVWRIRQRRRIGLGSVLLFFAALLLSLITHSSASLSGKWLQHRLKRIAAHHLAIESTPTEPIDATTQSIPLGSESDSHPPLLVVVTHEGQVWTINAKDGSLVAGFSTGPPLLVVDDHFEEGDDTSLESQQSSLAQSHIVPSMDGILYWRQDHTSNNKLVPIATIRDLVDNPIQLCQAEGENCDILAATALGPSLFSLNSQGSLNWARARSTGETTRAKPVPMERTASSGSDTDAEEDSTSGDSESTDNSSSKSSFLLQRQDYLVEQISAETGEQIFNITWGNLESLDFGEENKARNNHPNVHYLSSDAPAVSDLPSIIFGNQGKSLVAVLPQPPQFLWKQDFMSVVTNVLGIEKGAWQAVNMVAETDGTENESMTDENSSGRRKLHPELPSNSEPQAEEEAERWFWWWAGGGKGLGKKRDKNMEQFLVHGQEENGLIYVPRPPAQNFVRNSWYLNHLWASPQAQGEQHFQGYISDHSHRKEVETRKNNKNKAKPEKQEYSYPEFERDSYYDFDTSSMPKFLLLPPSEPPLSDPTTSGGIFLSWPLVMTIITLMVGTVGAAYVIYGQKKRKWMATSTNEERSPVSSERGLPDVTSETMSISLLRGRDISKSQERSRSRTQENSSRNSDSQIGTQLSQLAFGRPMNQVLNRSSSAPIMTGDHIPSFSGLLSQASKSNHQTDISSSEKLPVAIGEETAVVKPSPLLKHQSAPVESPHLPQFGVGMIDGIPLIRYSRYQSEFREMEPLGRGGFGTVFRVSNVLDGREYAVKKVSIRSSDWNSPGTEAFSQELHRVLREVKFLALLDHPSIVRYYTAWLEMNQNDKNTGVDENLNSGKLSRRFSSELLTSLDPTNGVNSESQTTSQSLLGSSKPLSSKSIATVSHLKGRNATNPLGWNNGFANFEESSASAFYPRHAMPVLPPTDEDCGFIFEERSNEDGEEEPSYFGHQPYSQGRSIASSEDSRSDFSHSVSSSWDASYSTNRRQKNAPTDNNKDKKKGKDEPGEKRDNKSSKHTLYIQMQLCSSKTLSDFLGNKEARQGPAAGTGSADSGSIDIPRALRLFLQIVQAVHHVHQQNLIHRDLKPSNCFIDETGTVKVGDFGLSRESNDSTDNSASTSLLIEEIDEGAGDNTVGVGTRSYASPEQMNGSDYDSKTDIYALGVMLFELLYPMYTGMERHICFQRLRTASTFPEGWHSSVSVPFPTLDELVRSMLSLNPKHRPTADEVARHIGGLLEEHSVSLNIRPHDGEIDKITFIRVEAKPVPDILKILTELIHDAAFPQTVDIVQYGMRSSTKSSCVAGQKSEERAILEFALATNDIDACNLPSWGSQLASRLQESDQVLVARQVWHQKPQSL